MFCGIDNNPLDKRLCPDRFSAIAAKTTTVYVTVPGSSPTGSLASILSRTDTTTVGATSLITSTTLSQSPDAPSESQTLQTSQSLDSSNDNKSHEGTSRKIGLGVGLGIGIPLIMGLTCVAAFCFWKKKHRQTTDQTLVTAELPTQLSHSPGLDCGHPQEVNKTSPHRQAELMGDTSQGQSTAPSELM
ncbi:hypothetical protein QQS21_011164 [Conoideocrella luteorostrata]|uniref:Mid2 domain-containing protein n=1 Tax=Conoideocrella luteorostrata TaxID=1105319 RepID=A0AAJ0FW54_9HYPO|nr:hypothetical protein QQS21_011164 [Conoideocrella luteorostrata]